jgi:hypothetical protein
MARKKFYETLVERADAALKDNDGKIGIYAIGFQSRRLRYGFDEKDLSAAVVKLKNTKYRGEIYFYMPDKPGEVNIYVTG